MGFACLFGHKWSGCKCERCAKIRDEQHDWDGCKCKICGTIRNERHTWKGTKCSVCGQTRSIDEITDHDILVKIATNDSNIGIRIKASENAAAKLTGQVLLADVVRSAKHITARVLAAQKLKDQTVLAEIIKSRTGIVESCKGEAGKDIYVDVRKAAVLNLTDKTLIADVLENAEYNIASYYYCDILYDRLKDQR